MRTLTTSYCRRPQRRYSAGMAGPDVAGCGRTRVSLSRGPAIATPASPRRGSLAFVRVLWEDVPTLRRSTREGNTTHINPLEGYHGESRTGQQHR